LAGYSPKIANRLSHWLAAVNFKFSFAVNEKKFQRNRFFDNKPIFLVPFDKDDSMKQLLQLRFKQGFTALFLLCFPLLCQAENPTLLVPQSPLIQTSVPVGGEDEIRVIEQLIVSTAAQLEMEKHLRELMLQFNKQQEEFIQGNQTKAHASRLVRTARQIYETITANRLEHLFAKDYLDELTFFSSIAGKTSVTRP
jgi:hypothetical protein